jgi:pimeloyl-ACP methyl ester carboxylesterase
MQRSYPIRVATLIVLSLSFSWEAAPARGESPAPGGPAEVKPHPCRVPDYDQDVLCATYPVWENRETRQGRKIGLNIVILPALGSDKQPDPIFEFGGGPGQAITGNADGYAQSGLRQKRDFVLIDQRGTGGSNPLHCAFYGEPADPRRAVGDLLPVDAVRKCRERLEKVADLSQYTTAAFADDVNEVRQWLGYGKINLSGGSYGTRMAQVYWRRYPETVRSVVLIGTSPLDSYIPLAHAKAGQRALGLLLGECASQPECRATFPDTEADLKAVKERVDKGVTVTLTNPDTGEKHEVRPTWGLIAEGIRFLMYGQGAANLPLQISKAAQGDLVPLVQMAVGRRLNIMEGLDWGLCLSVTCAEDLPFITEEMIHQKTPGTYLGDYRIRQQKAACEVWPRGKAAADIHEPVRSNIPVLLISGERDPVTPPEGAEQASRYMINRLHVVVPRGSHGAIGECTNNLIRDFTDRASVQGLDPSCAASAYGPTQFVKP